MTKYSIKLFSKDKKSFKSFLKIFKLEIPNQQLILNFIRKKKRKKITILKSPHVYKKAQEHYQEVTYAAFIKSFSWKSKKNNILLKKIKNYLFPDIKIKIKKFFSSNKKNLIQNYFLTPKSIIDYFTFKPQKIDIPKIYVYTKPLKIKNFVRFQVIHLKKTLTYLKILDTYGYIKRTYKNINNKMI